MDQVAAHAAFYLGLCALLTLEEAGVFLLPGDISLVAAGVYAAQGGPFILISWAVATLGMVAGSCVLFFGVRRANRSSRVLPDRARRLIQRHGAWGVAAARLVPGLRNATVLGAAAASLPPRVFLAGLIPASVLWSAFLLLLGWFGGAAILGALGRLDGMPAVRLLSVGLVLAAALVVVLRLRLTARDRSAGSES